MVFCFGASRGFVGYQASAVAADHVVKGLGFLGLQADTGAGSYALPPSLIRLIYALVDGECFGERSGFVQRAS